MIMMVMMIIMERIRAVINKSRIKVKVVMIMYIRIALFSVLIIKTSVIELEYMELHKWFINNVAIRVFHLLMASKKIGIPAPSCL